MSLFVQQNSAISSFDNGSSWVILSPIEQSIKSKIEKAGTPLKDWDIQIYRGVLTGCNEAFIISTEKRNEILANCQSEEERHRTEELIRPILRGRDIKRYAYEWNDQWIIGLYPARHYNIDDYPTVKDFLISNFGIERLEQSGKERIIDGIKVKSRKKTSNKWFETQDSISYWDDFNKPKIVWGNLNLNPSYALAEQGIIVNAPSTFLVPASKYLLAVLNSKVGDFYIRKLGVTRNGGYFEYKPMFVERLPVPQLTEKEQKIIENELDQLNDNEIEQLIFKLYELSRDEIKFIIDFNKK